MSEAWISEINRIIKTKLVRKERVRPMEQERQPTRYEHIYNDLRFQIQIGDFKPGDQLPSERTLARDYDVSRMTIREAFERLAFEHLIRREQGRGSFILGAPYTYTFGSGERFVDVIQAHDDDVSFQLVDMRMMKPDAQIQQKMNILAFDRVCMCQYLVLAQGRPVLYETQYVLVDAFPLQEAIAHSDIEAFVAATHSIALTKTTQSFTVGKLNAALALLLQAHEQDSSLTVSELDYVDNQVVAYRRIIALGHDFKYDIATT